MCEPHEYDQSNGSRLYFIMAINEVRYRFDVLVGNVVRHPRVILTSACHPEPIRCTQGKLREGSACRFDVLVGNVVRRPRVILTSACHPERSEGSPCRF